jgi:dynamin 1-like protein
LKPSLFVPVLAFENLVRQQIMRLRDPSIECCQLVHDELRKLLSYINISEIEIFESFKSHINDVMESVLIKCRAPTDEMIRNLIDIEMGFINTNHPDFQGEVTILSDVNPDNENNEEEDRGKNKK